MEGDGDPIAEPKLDTFSLLLPLPYRVAIIIVFGVWAWGANLQYLSLVGIDVPSLVRYPTRTSATAPTHALSTHRLALLLTLPLSISLLLFWSLTQLDVPLTLAHPYLPTLTLMLILILFCLPTATLLPRNLTNTPYALSHTGRYRTLATLRRIAVGGLAHPADGKFGDILLADALTSYAKVLGDLVIVLCTLVFRGGGAGGVLPNRGCGGALLVPAVVALPSAIRLRQCLIEFVRVREAQRRHGWDAGRGWGGQHLANAAKYASAFPVVVLSALQREAVVEGRWIGEVGLFRLWLFSVFLNSFYSFYWDVAKDWDLTLFSPDLERNDPEHPWGLRRVLYFRRPNLYYIVIGLDLVLRCTWSLKLSPHLVHFNDWESGIFTIELLEVFRRWVWVFFRVEAEWIRNNRGPAPDDVLLGEIHRKDDEDRID